MNLVIKNGDEFVTTSEIIADNTDTQHKNVLELIEQYLPQIEQFGPSAFETRKSVGRPTRVAILNEQQATFLLTLMRNSEVVVRFKVQLVKEFYRMRNELEANVPHLKLKFDMSLQLAQVAMAELNLAPSGRLLVLHKLEESYNLPAVLPRYAADNNGTLSANSSMTASSLTELLKKNESSVSAIKANAILTVLGFLEDKTRPSTKTPDKIKHYKSVTKAGEAYGKNMLHPSNPRETQPLWYDDTFGELLDLIEEHGKTAA